MHLLLSGEGPSDIGVCNPASGRCGHEHFIAGPMAWMVDQLVQQYQGYEYSWLTFGGASYVSKQHLVELKPEPVKKKSMGLPGKRTPRETRYYFNNARALAQSAKQIAAELNDCVIAVLFRDSDGTASAGRGEWSDKYRSMMDGFEIEAFSTGVPMLPKPKSEAWLLCALRDGYQHCQRLEKESGNDKGMNPLKEQLVVALDGNVSARELSIMVQEGEVDPLRIDMTSFNCFKTDLEAAVRNANRADQDQPNNG